MQESLDERIQPNEHDEIPCIRSSRSWLDEFAFCVVQNAKCINFADGWKERVRLKEESGEFQPKLTTKVGAGQGWVAIAEDSGRLDVDPPILSQSIGRRAGATLQRANGI